MIATSLRPSSVGVVPEPAAAQGVKLRFPAEQVAAALGGIINGLAFERAIDPDALPEQLAAFFVSVLVRESLEPEPRPA
ncbi:MAG: hypothetical protein FJW90_01100 [Actinobacteria bacterium]|nr:hypothetical protein [Actinomycetota bacterium]